MFKQCQDLAATTAPVSSHLESDKGHGRLTTRQGQCLDMSELNWASRWSDSGIHTLVVVERETWMPAKQKTTCETAFYISNQGLASHPKEQAQALTRAIREHWHVESENWIRDVTFNEDHVKTTSPNQGQVMGSLRRLAIHLLRRFKVLKFQAALEDFADCPSSFEAFLRRVKFL